MSSTKIMQPGVTPQQDQKIDQSIQNIPNRRSIKDSAAKKAEKAASAFRTISEVATELKVEQHVLRFWESKFSQIKPLKRGGGRRYYRPEDISLLKNIHHLLYSEGYTIKGVQKLLQSTRGNLSGRVAPAAPEVEAVTETPPVAPKSPLAEKVSQNKDELQAMLDELKAMRDLIG